eukprot:Tamp_09276.p1 GENE.Tamp_09276~~Tamp_09276.p1  ORF type:complete len:614 (+),score=112.62 Tamp_09276:187-1842(+)
MSAGAGELRDSFAPGIALVPGAQAQNLAAHGAAIVFVPQARANLTAASDARSAGRLWLGDAGSPLAPYSDLLVRTVLERNRPGVNPQQELSGCFLAVDLPNERSTRVIAVAVKEDISMYQALELAGKAVSLAMEVHPSSIALVDAWTSPTSAKDGVASSESVLALEAGVAAVLAAIGPMPTELQSEVTPHGVETLVIYSSALDAARLQRIQATAEGTNVCRYLTATPANSLSTARYRAWLRGMAAKEGWSVTELDQGQLSALGCGAFLAVAQASEDGSAALMRLVYHPKTASDDLAPLTLVGKGITFDTGGVNVKGAAGMYGMKRDMSGSAAALGALLALTRLEFARPVECWLAVADNALGPRAYKPDDVVTAVDGTSIEIVHTDAEGRMVLADTLALASRKHRSDKLDAPGLPALVVDFATLTGACIGALSKRYAGAFSNREALNGVLIAAGKDSGERLWPFPMDADFDAALKSSVADVLQCTVSSEADHILAAVFLKKFVNKDVKWVHLDLCPAAKPGGLGHVMTEETGFGVRASLSLVLDHWEDVANT